MTQVVFTGRKSIEELIGNKIEPPCCARMDNGSWCTLPDGHSGPHDGPAPMYGPHDSTWYHTHQTKTRRGDGGGGE